jgi:FkbM family methyltransferase
MKLKAPTFDIVLGLAILGALYGAFHHPSAQILSSMLFAGRTPECSTREAFLGLHRSHLYGEKSERIVKASRIIEIVGKFRQIETPHGRFWEVVPQSGGSEVLAQLAEIESKYAYRDLPIRPGDVVLDCGANVGTFTRYALEQGARSVIAIEPGPDNLECLRRNINDSRVIVYPKGVWDRDELLTLYESNVASAMDSFVISENSKPGPRIPLTTVDRIVSELKISRVDFIKMDIEGAESRALRGAQSTLSRFHPRLELESSESPALLIATAREGWKGYGSHCLVCINDGQKRTIKPSLIGLW